ncbi:MAG: tripartite tricarboxylate transporter substrate binding protein [Betaproteobacteria bacterium]|nr:tripartite tricarboxylate transporter substrate binding protein [Betaproteobacteria bacterium]MBK9608728.1 tripartite tricarboxylate transporter substrate binding protein [Betaproteobacteria bacterium]
MKQLVTRLAATLAACAIAIALPVVAQTFPTKPIRLVVPFAPGGSSEIIARTVALKMSESMGQQVIVDNKPGGAGNIAMQEVARAAPDGYTLILGHIGTLAVNPYMFAKLPYDVNKDFIPISLLAKVPTVYVVNADLPVKDLKDLVTLARQREVFYGSAGNASAGHLATEYLKLSIKAPLTHVPYKGTGPQLQDLLGGRTDASAAGVPALLQHIKSGKLRAIAVGNPQRVPTLPDVQTVAEQGYPGFETSQWYGLIGPAGIPEAIVKRLTDEAAKAVRSKEVQEKFAADSATGVGDTPAEFAAFIKVEQARWERVVKSAGIKAD